MKKRILSLVLSLACLLALSAPTLAAEAPAVGHGYYWEGVVSVEGMSVCFNDGHTTYHPIQYNENLYIPLVNVGEWTASSVKWDPEEKEISFQSDSNLVPHYRGTNEQVRRTDKEFEAWRLKWQEGLENGFEVTLLTDTVIKKDGEEIVTVTPQGTALFPIAYEGAAYLPLRTAAQLVGKVTLYMDYLYSRRAPIVFLYQTPTKEQISAARAYFLEVDALIRDGWNDLSDLGANDTDQLRTVLTQTKEDLLRIKTPSVPDLPILQNWVQDSLFGVIDNDYDGVPMLEQYINWTIDPKSNFLLDPYGLLTADSVSKRVHSSMENHFRDLSRTLTAMRVFTEAMTAGELR